jgi:hypothetical protein
MGKKTVHPQPTPENPAVANEAPAPAPEAVPAALPEGPDQAAPVPEGAGEPVADLDGQVADMPAGDPGPQEVKPGEPAPDAEASPPAPADPVEPPPTWAELHAMAEMLERFGRRLLQVEDRAAKMALILHQNYGVRI